MACLKQVKRPHTATKMLKARRPNNQTIELGGTFSVRGFVEWAHRGEVRGDAKMLLRAPLGYPEPCHDLVEAQQRSLLCAQRPQPLPN